MNNKEKIIFPILIIFLSILSSYCLSDFATRLTVEILKFDDVPSILKVYMSFSNVMAALFPVIIFAFFFITSKIMMNTFFDMQIPSADILASIGFSLVPLLLHQYFFWYNLVEYCTVDVINKIDDLHKVTFFCNMHLADFERQSIICWFLFYVIASLYFIFKKYDTLKVVVSVLIPSCIVIICYNII